MRGVGNVIMLSQKREWRTFEDERQKRCCGSSCAGGEPFGKMVIVPIAYCVSRPVQLKSYLSVRGALYHLLQNRIYLGEVVHKGISYPGEQAAIVDEELWRTVQAKLSENF
jgi:hypothetical protein